MDRDWERQFGEWAKPPGKTEEERCSNAESAIKNAIAASPALEPRSVSVFTQGSYANRVNVRRDSDVDIGVLCRDTFIPQYPKGIDEATYGHDSATYHYSDFRKDLGDALKSYFGVGAVSDGKKAFDVHETSYHVEADVVPLFEHRRYHKSGGYIEGVALLPKLGGWIYNWPDQHYENGVTKNTATGRRYKGGVRILKALRNEMDEAGSAEARAVSGFFVECLVWNAPNWTFEHDTWDERIQSVLRFLWQNTNESEKCKEWGEVSELKYLFWSDERRVNAFKFIDKAWDHVGVR